MKKVSFGVIGVGGVGRHHIKCMKQIDEVEVIAVADINEQIGRAVAEEFKVEWYKDYTKMIERDDIDAVSICTPHFLHCSMTLDCIKAGKHVLVEKPMARTVAECDLMIEEAKRAGVKLGVVFQNRTNPVAMAIKEYIVQGNLGELYRGSLEYFTFRSQAYYNSGAWRGTWSMEGGGVLINQGIHFIDLFQWFIGLRPKRISAFMNNLLHKIEVEDLASAILEYEGGVQTIMQFSTIDQPGYTRVTLRGDKALLVYEQGKAKVAVTEPPLSKGIPESERWGRPKAEWTELEPKQVEISGHAAVIKDFALAVLEDREPMVPGEEGIKSVEIVNGIIMSAATGKVVEFPLDRQLYDKVISKLSELKRIELVKL